MAAAAALSSSSPIRFKAMLLAVTRWPCIKWKSGQNKSRLGIQYEEHVMKLAGTLAEHCGYQSVEVHLPKSSDMTQKHVKPDLDSFVKIFSNETLDKETIKKKIETFLDECKNEGADRAFLLLNSHGFVKKDQYFFCPENGSVDLVQEPQVFERETMLSYDEIESLARKFCRRNRLLIVDTCCAGALEGALRPLSPLEVSKADVGFSSEQEWLELLRKLLVKKDMEGSMETSMFCSCGSDESSMNCFFIEALTSGLRGEAKLEPYHYSATSADDELENVRVVTLGNLYEHIMKTIGKGTNQRIERLVEQHQTNGHKKKGELPKTQRPILVKMCQMKRLGDVYVALHRNLELVELKRAKTKVLVLVVEETDVYQQTQLNAKYDSCWELLKSCENLRDDVKQSFENLKRWMEFRKRPTCVVVVGRLLTGKSSLINALLDAYIRPTSTQTQGTLTLVAVNCKEETDSDRDTVSTTLVYKNQPEWEETVRKYTTDKEAQGEECVLIKKLDLQIKSEDSTFSALIRSPRDVFSLPSKPLGDYKTEELSDEICDKGPKPTERSYPLLKRVEVTLSTNTRQILNDGRVLIDLPGTGSTELSLRKLTERAVAEADIVCVVDPVDSVLRSEDVATVLRKCKDASEEGSQERILVATKGDTPARNFKEKEKRQILEHLEEEEKKLYDDFDRQIADGEQMENEEKLGIRSKQKRLLIQARNKQLQRKLEDKYKMKSGKVFVVSSEDYLCQGRDDGSLESYNPMEKSQTGIDSLRQHIIGCSCDVQRRMHRKQIIFFQEKVRETRQKFLSLQKLSIEWSATVENSCQALRKAIESQNKTLRSKENVDAMCADKSSRCVASFGTVLVPSSQQESKIEIVISWEHLTYLGSEVSRHVSQHKSAVKDAMQAFLYEMSCLKTAPNSSASVLSFEDHRKMFNAYEKSIAHWQLDKFVSQESQFESTTTSHHILETLLQKRRQGLEAFLKQIEIVSTSAGVEVMKPFINLKLVEDNDELDGALKDFLDSAASLSERALKQLTST